MRVFHLVLKGGAFLLVFFVVAVFVRLATRGDIAQADSALYNPSYCLGAWGNPTGASGAPQAKTGDPLHQFPPEQAAYLAPDSVSLIFCGYFNVEAKDNAPKSARVSFVWAHDGSSASAPVSEHEDPIINTEETIEIQSETHTVSDPATEPSQADSADAQSSETVTVDETTIQPPEESDTEKGGVEESVSSPEMQSETHEPGPAPQPSSPTGESPSQTDTPAPVVESAPAAWLTIIGNILSLTATEAYATEEAEHAFLKVSYSFDGVRWFTAGQAHTGNWDTFSVDIPATSWEDLHNLQIMILPLPGERPSIYLDAIELSVENDLTLIETALEGAEATLAVVDAVADSLIAVTEDLTHVFVTEETNQLAAVDVSQTQESIEEPPVPAHKETRLAFSLAGPSIKATRNLAWYDPEFAATLTDEPELVDPKVSITDGVMTVSGQCTREFFVVLFTKNVDDYTALPPRLASNYAASCVNNSFSYTVTHLPANTHEGPYYLLLAEQDATTPWVPLSNLQPVTLSRVDL